MIELEKTKKIQDFAEKKIKEHNQELNEATENLQEIKNKIYYAITDLKNVSDNDKEKQDKYQNILLDLEDKRQFAEARVQMLNQFPVITHELYEEFIKAILNEIKEAETNTRMELIELSEEAERKGKELKKATELANDVLCAVQKELYQVKEPKTYDTFSTCLWAGAGVDTLVYRVETNKNSNESIKKLTKI